jgi:AraC family transcriptional regulator of adaptative response/methylated-DNA-[protein]-cysteine methyltransferase
MLNQERCWAEVLERDASRDGAFFFGVVTTGVYCKPSCPARRPLRKNVRFFETGAAAEAQGLRACLRCRPSALGDPDPDAERIRAICRHIEEHAGEPLKLRDLAAQAALSPFHFQRSFKKVAGVTPREYVEAARLRRFKSALKTAKGVTDAVFEAGYESASSAYERSAVRLGMTPKQYREGARDLGISYAVVASPVGPMLVAATDRGLCSVQFGDAPEQLVAALRCEYPHAQLAQMTDASLPALEAWVAALSRHLAGAQPHIDLPLDIRHTAFQMRVWAFLQSIPYGEVRSYADVAAAIGSPNAIRAVARACSQNPLAVVIPCHRVIRGSGELAGYRWGLARKRALLDLEASRGKSTA